jgi:hypothetical protein
MKGENQIGISQFQIQKNIFNLMDLKCITLLDLYKIHYNPFCIKNYNTQILYS